MFDVVEREKYAIIRMADFVKRSYFSLSCFAFQVSSGGGGGGGE
jgi:hypothetical protein